MLIGFRIKEKRIKKSPLPQGKEEVFALFLHSRAKNVGATIKAYVS